jgi:pimeloyl-ACP methyl ester carboxylesterase
MPYAKTGDNISLYYEDTGTGPPIVFAHEYASDVRGWEAQVRHFSRDYRCVTFNARGYPPSDVPERDDQYGQDQAASDIGAVLDHLQLKQAFVVGLSMGAAAALHFTMRHPQRVLGLVFASGGSGAHPATRERFISEALQAAQLLQEKGMQPLVEGLAYGATRIQLLNKDPRSWEDFRRHLSEHSALGSALTMRNYQARRPSLHDFEAQLKGTHVPTLILAGDEDDPVLETSLFIKRCMPAAGLHVLPRTGHAVNLEEPGAFNQAMRDFLSAVERQRWGPRDARAQPLRSAVLPDQQIAGSPRQPEGPL